MALFVLTDASVTINGVDLSDHVESVTINYGAETQPTTAMSETAESKISGLIDWSVDINFRQDFAASKVDATLFALVGGAAVTCIFLPTSSSVSSTNPSFTGSALLTSYPPISGSVGETAMASCHLEGTGVLTRATS